MKKTFLILFISALFISGCTENYSNGERVGFITKLTKKGIFWESYEVEMNVSQTGMTSNATEFDFSIDNDQNDTEPLRLKLDSAATLGWKVRVKYHQVFGKNWFGNRGHSDYFVTNVIIEDKTPMQTIFGDKQASGRVIDTIYLVLDKSQVFKK